jgi:gamma-glutamyltranspeptidase/glutathione hydrolase
MLQAARRLLAHPWLAGTLLAVALLVSPAAALPGPPAAAVASAHPLATRAGVEILDAGGNAFDAAVAVAAALSVVEPYSTGLGGGGFWLLHRQSDGRDLMVDARERAPLAAHSALYLSSQGQVIPGASLDGALAGAIPGTPAALAYVAAKYGVVPLQRSLSPAIRLARKGFRVNERLHRFARLRRKALESSPEASRIFLPGGEPPPAGSILKQPELADALEAIATRGATGFYDGWLARRLVDGVRAAGGIWTMDDLQQYRVVERRPIEISYRGASIVSASPPSSGGVAIGAMLRVLSGYDLDQLPEPQRVHLIVEAMRQAYRDRAQYLGDPDFWAVPVTRLLSEEHARSLRAMIRPDQATPSTELSPVPAQAPRGADTTHLSVIDREGNRVAATLSINFLFGSGFIPPGTGVLVNDEMDDFVAKPGVPNTYGLVGGRANSIEPGKRPLSSMSPTFVETPRGVAVLGTPGGSRIISMVLLGILEYLQGGDAQAIVDRHRFHHQYLPDQVLCEGGAFSQATLNALIQMGYVLRESKEGYGNMQVVVWDRKQGTLSAASDSRGIGKAMVTASVKDNGVE